METLAELDSESYRTPIRSVYRDLSLIGKKLQSDSVELKTLFVELDLPELAIRGPAVVQDICNAPVIEAGEGSVVTATFRHEGGNVIDLVVGEPVEAEGQTRLVSANASAKTTADVLTSAMVGSQVIGTTSNHPFWSVDRQEYVQAGTLQIGERLQSYDGGTFAVLNKLPKEGLQTVYNLEVYGEHVYYVGEDGLLVHNSKSYATTSGSARRPGGYRAGDTDAHGLLSPGVNRASGHTNTTTDGLVQSHHGIQRAWAKRNITDYDENAAPGILLKSSSGEVHAKLSAAQRARRRQPGGWDTDIKTEFRLSYREMIDAGLSVKEAQRVIKQNYKYFDSIKAFK